MAHVRMAPDARKSLLLSAAVAIAKKSGVLAVTRASVARDTGVTPALINRYFEGRNGLRWEAIEAAKSVEVTADALKCGYQRADLEKIVSKNMVAQAAKSIKV